MNWRHPDLWPFLSAITFGTIANAWTNPNRILRPGIGLFPTSRMQVKQNSIMSLEAVATSSTANSTAEKTDASQRHMERVKEEICFPFSLSLDELSTILGGKGRAQACWDCFRLGVDPLWFYADRDINEQEPLDMPLKEWDGWTRSQFQAAITPRRQSQGMGQKALQRYKHAYSNAGIQKNKINDSKSDTLAAIARIVRLHRSQDGTTKLLLQLGSDGLQVECVVIPWDERQSSTLCVSNQVGCGQACTFCSTGRMGEIRSLTCDEILVQVYLASKVCRLIPGLYPVDAIVFMGMGEAARNADNVVRSACQLTNSHLFQLAPKRITISTVGPAPESFQQLGNAPAVLAWSVHASQDSVRKQLVPTTKFSMVELRDALIQVLLNRPRKMRQTMLELALIENINDHLEDATHLVEFCQAFYERVPGVKVVVNLIPWNDISVSSGPASKYRKPSEPRVLDFQKVLVDHGILSYVRTTRGDDENSACGQLATKAIKRRLP